MRSASAVVAVDSVPCFGAFDGEDGGVAAAFVVDCHDVRVSKGTAARDLLAALCRTMLEPCSIAH